MASGLENLLGKYNLYLDARALLEGMDLKPDSDPGNPDILICFCPLHQEPGNRSLRVNLSEKRFHCEDPDCPGHAGGDLINLHALVQGVLYEDAGLQIFHQYGLPKTEDTQVLKRNLYIAFSEKLTAEDLFQAAKNMLLASANEYPDNLVIISRLINIYTREQDHQRVINYLLKAARIVARNRNYNSARTALRRVFALEPENAKAREMLSEILVEEWSDFYFSPHAPLGEQSLFESLAEIPLTPALRTSLTEIFLKNKRLKMIERLYSDLPEDPDDEQKVHLREVTQNLEKSVSQYPDPKDLFILLADLRIKLGEYGPAQTALLSARKAVEQGGSPERREEVEQLLKNFEEMLLKKEYDYAQILMQTGKYEEALMTLNKTLATDQITPELSNKMIHCHFKLNRFPEAHRLCVKLADHYKALGKYQESALALYHGLLFQPAHRETIINLIEIFRLLGDNDSAEQVAELAERQVIVESKTHPEKVMPRAIPAAPSPPRKEAPSPEEALPPPAKEQEFEIQLPFAVKLYTSSTSTDRITNIETITISLSSHFIVTNCGNVKIPGIQPVSVNFVLQNCQIQGMLTIPDRKEPVRLFGKIIKVQNRLISNNFHKIVTIELPKSDDPGMKIFQKFIESLTSGDFSLTPPPEEVMELPPKPAEGRIDKELLVSTRFLDEAGEEKTPDFFYANTMSLSEDGIVLNFGEMKIACVPTPSQNYFLKNSTFEMTIPLPEPNLTVRLFGQAKNIRNKIIRGKRSKIIEVVFGNSPERDWQMYLDYVKGLHS